MSIRTKKVVTILGVFILFLFANALMAQCPMCKIAAESNMKNGGTAGRGLNAGILYMLAAPYLIVGSIAFLWWKNRKKAAMKPTDMFSDN
jgi:uncharacterized iron-regulated membrane protein